MEYNGWTNYETWVISMWIDNDVNMYENTIMIANWYRLKFRDGISQFSNCLKEMVESVNPLCGECSPYADLMNAALSEIDYYEIAEHYTLIAKEREG